MAEVAPGTRIGLVGLGRMGLPMAARLVDAGYSVQGFDIDPAARGAAERRGITAAPDLAGAVKGVGAVVLMLATSGVVRSVLENPSVLDALTPGALVVDMGSSEPGTTQELAGKLRARGVRMIDAPVSGGVAGAVAGTLTIMVGGEAEDVADAQPLLSAMGNAVHIGPVGAGDVAKSLNNLLSATHLWATSEAVLAGERFGIDPEVLLAVFNTSSGRSGSTEAKWPRFVLPGTYDSGFSLALMLKDMRIAVDLCESVGQSVSLGADAVALWERAAADLPATADHTEVARWLRRADGSDRG
jgi:3-hydroxyisobutyrate dehydrogenase